MTGLCFTHSQTCSLIKQWTFGYATTGFLNSIITGTDHVSLPKSCFSASDWLKRCFNQSEALLADIIDV